MDAAKPGENPISNTNGSTEWVATRNKYFAVVLLSDDNKADGAYLEGRCEAAPDHGIVEHYSIGLKLPFKNADEETTHFTLFIGPLDYDIIKSYSHGLDHIMSLGWSWIRPITVLLVHPPFQISAHFHFELRHYHYPLLHYRQGRTPSVDAKQHEVDEENASAAADDGRNSDEIQRRSEPDEHSDHEAL